MKEDTDDWYQGITKDFTLVQERPTPSGVIVFNKI